MVTNPTPGFAHLKPKLTLTSKFDPSLEKTTPPTINTNLLDILDISLVDLVINLLVNEDEDINNEREYVPWLRKPGYMSADYYQRQEKRSELIRERSRAVVEEFDYGLWLRNSFVHVDSEPKKFHFNFVKERDQENCESKDGFKCDAKEGFKCEAKDGFKGILEDGSNDAFKNISRDTFNGEFEDNFMNKQGNKFATNGEITFTETWELFPKEENYRAIHFTDENPSNDFILQKEERNRIFAFKEGVERVYSSIKNDITEYLVIEFGDDGKAYYSRIKDNHRLKETKLKIKDED